MLQQAWARRGWLARLLWPVAMAYRLAMAVRTGLYRTGVLASWNAGIPVVVVGNVVVGGGGKTPLIMALAAYFLARGVRVGVISRGYGRHSDGCLEVHADSNPLDVGDEPLLIKRRTGAAVFVAERRIDAARALRIAHPDTRLLLCDDGLQHHALQRDVDVIVFDDRGLANGWMLPAGPLREPWPRSLNDSALVLHTGTHPAFGGFHSSRRLADAAVDPHGTPTPLQALRGRTLVAVAAIANPDAFFNMLEARGLVLASRTRLPDHDDFSAFRFPPGDDCTVLCTEKDAAKLFALPRPSGVKVLAVPLEFSPEQAFLAALDARLAPHLSLVPSSHGH